MKVLIATSAYQKHLDQIYQFNPELENLSSTEQTSFLQKKLASSFEYWSREFQKKGWDSVITYVNLKRFQNTWLKEHGFKADFNELHPESTFLKQVQYYKPDLIFLFDHNLITKSFLDKIREESKNTKLIATWYGAPNAHEENLKYCDLILTNSKDLRDKLNNLGAEAHYLSHAFEPSIYENSSPLIDKREIPFAFVGTLNKDPGTHAGRTQLIEELVDLRKLKVWSSIEKVKLYDYIKILILSRIYDITHSIKKKTPLNNILKVPPFSNWNNMEVRPNPDDFYNKATYQNLNPPVFGDEMLILLSQCYVLFNGHTQHTGRRSVNMRLFEGSGMGTCQLVDDLPTVKEHFVPDSEIVTYSSASEAKSKAKELLANPSLCIKIGKASKAKTMAKFTTKNQVNGLIGILVSIGVID